MKRRGSAGRILVAMLAACAVFALFPATAFAIVSTDTTEGIKDGKLAINEANFPDPNFRNYISEKFDAESSTISVTVNGQKKDFTFVADEGSANDGYLTENELNKKITHIYCSNLKSSADKKIKSLKGIEYFKGLAWLNCEYNGLSEKEMDFLNDENLQKQWAGTLKGLQCAGNYITNLNLSAYSSLETLGCIYDSNSVTKLKTLIVNSGIQKLYCYNNDLQGLDVSKCTNLIELNCDYNPHIGSLDVRKSKGLKWLFCNSTGLKELDVSENTELETLRCPNNNLQKLDVTKNEKLKILECYNNQLASLDVSKNSNLTDFASDGNNKYKIAVGTDCKFELTQLPGFDANKMTVQAGGTVSGTTLTVEPNAQTVTYTYNCGNNKSATFTLQVHHHDFGNWEDADATQHKHKCTADDGGVEYENHTYDSDGTTCTVCWHKHTHKWEWHKTETEHWQKCNDVNCQAETAKTAHNFTLELAKEKGQLDKRVCECGYAIEGVAVNSTNFPDSNFLSFVSKEFDKDNNQFITSTELAEITEIDCDNQGIGSLQGIEYFTALTALNCESNNLKALDVSKNINLESLKCGNNDFSEKGLNVSALKRLKTLIAFQCKLKTLDISNNELLDDFNASDNDLTVLNLSKNTAMKYLWIANNDLTELDLKGLDNLEDVIVNGNKLTVLDLSDKTHLNKVNIQSNQLTSLTLGKTALELWKPDGNKYEITTDSQRRFDLKDLPKGFDVTKVVEGSWNGGKVDADGILTVAENVTEVTYTYNCGDNDNNKNATFTLEVVVHKHSYAKDDWQLDTTDPTKHWHKCTDLNCPDEDKGIVRETHKYGADGKCIYTGCGAKHDPHTYGEWTEANEKQHKRTCTEDGIEEYADHHFNGDVCTDCGYTRNHVHDYGTEWKKDETGHWHECTANDGSKTAVEEHVYADDAATTCSICGYERTLPGPDPVDPVDPDPVVPDHTFEDEFGGAMSAVIVGGTAVWGAYEAGTGIYRMLNMRGLPMPSDRIGLAMLVWEQAGKPQPASTALYTDIEAADLNAQKAARWVVEQGLLLDDGEQFHPDGFVGKLRVCFAWDEAKQKGLVA